MVRQPPVSRSACVVRRPSRNCERAFGVGSTCNARGVEPGVAVQREVEAGYVWSAIPVRVIEDSGGRIALYRARGTECWWPSHPLDEHPPPPSVTQLPQAWEHGLAGLLTIVEQAAGHSVSLMWDDNWTFVAWYVDFIRPYERTPIGWDFTDLHLDLVVDASGAWRVKDADDLSAATLGGRMTGREAETVKENCAALVDQLTQGRSLVDPRWIEWRPDSAWRTPSLHFDRGTRLATAPTPAMEDLTLDAWI